MKIAIPAESAGHDPAVSTSFGRAAYFLVYDEETGSIQTLENTAAQSAGGAGIKAAQTVADSGAEVLLTPQCGENAAKVLLAAGLKMYKTSPGLSVMDNVQAFREGKLEGLTEIHEGYHGH